MSPAFRDHLGVILREIESGGLFKRERLLLTPQGARIGVAESGGPRTLVNLCANNYLGLANHPAVLAAAHQALDRWGFGLSSVRFICGTQAIHRELEEALSAFLGTEDTLLYSSCFDANGGVFEVLLGEQDAVVSDALNHASIIDGIRLSRARRLRYANRDVGEMRARVREARAAGARFVLVVTDGVFSMDGTVAPLAELCACAEQEGALVMVDDSHAVGVLGEHGAGTPSLCGVRGRVDILTGTLGKAMGGANGGYVSGPRALIEVLRQRSRPYLFSNSVAPCVAAASLAALRLVRDADDLRARLDGHTRLFRAALEREGVPVRAGTHPIVPIMVGEAADCQRIAEQMGREGYHVVGFFHPVVPPGQARIRTQVSAAHDPADLEAAARAFGRSFPRTR